MYCKDCSYRNESGNCSNKYLIDIRMNKHYPHSFTLDSSVLVRFQEVKYDSYFWVGNNFGCIHFKQK
jgi:hypothetical protein